MLCDHQLITIITAICRNKAGSKCAYFTYCVLSPFLDDCHSKGSHDLNVTAKSLMLASLTNTSLAGHFEQLLVLDSSSPCVLAAAKLRPTLDKRENIDGYNIIATNRDNNDWKEHGIHIVMHGNNI